LVICSDLRRVYVMADMSELKQLVVMVLNCAMLAGTAGRWQLGVFFVFFGEPMFVDETWLCFRVQSAMRGRV
jgi:hypothetical protein